MGEQERLMRSMMNLGCIWHRVLEKQMADLGLSSIQSRMLGHLYFQTLQKKRVFQRDLEEEFEIRKSSVTSVIQILEKKGLVRRIGVPGDARKKELVLTDQGAAVQETVLKRLDGLEALACGSLSQEEKKLWLSCIQKIETRLKEAEYD